MYEQRENARYRDNTDLRRPHNCVPDLYRKTMVVVNRDSFLFLFFSSPRSTLREMGTRENAGIYIFFFDSLCFSKLFNVDKKYRWTLYGF